MTEDEANERLSAPPEPEQPRRQLRLSAVWDWIALFWLVVFVAVFVWLLVDHADAAPPPDGCGSSVSLHPTPAPPGVPPQAPHAGFPGAPTP